MINKINEKIIECEAILKEEFTPDNAKTLTYGDKLAALGALNAYVNVMKMIDSRYDYDFIEKFSELLRPYSNDFASHIVEATF